MSRTVRFIIAALVSVTAPSLGAQQRATDSSAVVSVAAKFHSALASGDSVSALALLTENVQVVESGGVEDRAEYRKHHLPADIAYAKAVPSTRTIKQVTIAGDAAWIVATSTSTGQFNGRAVNSQGAELMVLARTPQGWKISAIHWSSRARR